MQRVFPIDSRIVDVYRIAQFDEAIVLELVESLSSTKNQKFSYLITNIVKSCSIQSNVDEI